MKNNLEARFVAFFVLLCCARVVVVAVATVISVANSWETKCGSYRLSVCVCICVWVYGGESEKFSTVQFLRFAFFVWHVVSWRGRQRGRCVLNYIVGLAPALSSNDQRSTIISADSIDSVCADHCEWSQNVAKNKGRNHIRLLFVVLQIFDVIPLPTPFLVFWVFLCSAIIGRSLHRPFL